MGLFSVIRSKRITFGAQRFSNTRVEPYGHLAPFKKNIHKCTKCSLHGQIQRLLSSSMEFTSINIFKKNMLKNEFVLVFSYELLSKREIQALHPPRGSLWSFSRWYSKKTACSWVVRRFLTCLYCKVLIYISLYHRREPHMRHNLRNNNFFQRQIQLTPHISCKHTHIVSYFMK